MHLRTDIEISQFLLQIKKCSNDVFYETSEGDILNLSSTLSQYVFCTIANHPQYWKTGIVRCKYEEDYKLLSEYLIEDER
jgi:hypothetical protein